VGFVRGAPPGDVGWLATRIADFLAMPSGG